MGLLDHPAVKFIRKNAKHLEAIAVIILLLGLWGYFYHDYNIKQEISENCGWGEDDYYCYCEKSQAMEIKNKIDSQGLGEINFSLAGVNP